MKINRGNYTQFFPLLALLGAPLLLSGCSMEAALISLQNKSLIVSRGQLTGFVSSSVQNEKTVSGYKVQSSSGDYSDKIEETTSGGYKVYISVQGNIISGP